MKSGEKGLTIVELIITLAITLVVTGASATALYQIFGGTDRNNSHLTTVRQTENAAFWINRDAQMAESISTSNLTAPNFLSMNWTEWDSSGQAIYYSSRYYFDNITANVGRLKRDYWSSTGINQQTLVGLDLYYNLGDGDNTSRVSYQNPLLQVRLVSIAGKIRETREYLITRRPNVN